MAESKMTPTDVSVESFLTTVDERRKDESLKLIELMMRISGEEPVMWGPSIVGFGSMNYEYPSGRKGIMPVLGFSPRKAALTIYMEGFDDYLDLLEKLGKHKITTACLYINKLEDVDFDVLSQMIERSYKTISASATKPQTVEEYVDKIPDQTKEVFSRLRKIVMDALPQGAKEDISYGIIGYGADGKRLKVYISGWKDHVALYPAPKNEELLEKLKPYIHGRGTVKFSASASLPTELIRETVKSLVEK